MCNPTWIKPCTDPSLHGISLLSCAAQRLGLLIFFFSPLDICKYRIPQLSPSLMELFPHCRDLNSILEHVWSCPMYNHSCRGINALTGQPCSLLESRAVSTRAVCSQIVGCAAGLYCFLPATDPTLRATDTARRPFPSATLQS